MLNEDKLLPYENLLDIILKDSSKNCKTWISQADYIKNQYSQEYLIFVFGILYKRFCLIIDQENDDLEISEQCDYLRDNMDIFYRSCEVENINIEIARILKELGEE